MSFSSDIKKELCVVKDMPQSEMSAMLYGIFYASRITNGMPLVQTEKMYLLNAVRTLCDEVFPAVKHETVRLVKNSGSLYTFRIKDGYNMIAESYGDFSRINASVISGNDDLSGAFLRGIFAACGSVTDPNKEYHLEIVLPDRERAEALYAFINEHGMGIKTTVRTRRSRVIDENGEVHSIGSLVLYAKESELIEDFLTYIGAGNHSMEIMQVKIMKDFRNRVNRSVNCESANLDKTVAAAGKSVEDIEYIYNTKGAEWLSEELRETAELRIEYPEMPLSELCQQFRKPISRSGLNHRLKKLSKLADELRNNTPQ
ncbi:MAG: DNA-binding protein WhiA [Oscillospiraceae bacterium]|nr:DNA-binding protein WhiA [Oscillospiraceae bacterium]